MDPAVERARQIRQGILRILSVHDQVGMDLGYTASELSQLTAGDIFGADTAGTGAEIRDLVERTMIRKVDGTNPPRFVLTAAGRDFVRAKFPWSKVDPFSGGDKP